MRIGLLSEFPASLKAGWPTTVLRMRAALEGRGHRAELLFEARPALRPSARLRRLFGRGEITPLCEEQLERGAAEADRRAARTDLILSVVGSPLLARMRSPQPVAYVADATWRLLRSEYPEHREAERANDEIERAILERAALQIYSSEWARSSAVEHYGVALERTVVVPFGANLEPDGRRLEEHGPERGARCELLFVGRDWHRKGGDLALSALDALLAREVDARLTIVGPDSLRLPRFPNGALRHLGWLDVSRPAGAAALEKAFRGAHFLLLPTRADCTPIVCAEAASFALPTIASEVGGLRAMVEPGVNGRLLDRSAGGSDFADEVERLWSDSGVYTALRRSSRARFEQRLNWNAWAADVERALSGALA